LDIIFSKPRKWDEKPSSAIDSSVLKKLAADELIFDPFCIVFFYTIIGLLERKNIREIKSKIVANYWETQKMSWKIWPLVQLVNFAIVPGNFSRCLCLTLQGNLRILFINAVSFFWGIFLQLKAGKRT
jgi:protein Mpv17